MVKSAWTDLNVDGRRCERIIKFCETMYEKESKRDNRESDDLILAYIDRLIKATSQKNQLVDMVLGIKQIRRLAEKQYSPQLIEERINEGIILKT